MRNAEATRERILEAALAEFSAYGIAGARVDRIAQAAGCNKNLIYIYFEDKETLFTTVQGAASAQFHNAAPSTAGTAWTWRSGRPSAPRTGPATRVWPAHSLACGTSTSSTSTPG